MISFSILTIGHFLAGLALYFIINWIGRHAVDFGYHSTSIFEDDDSSLALNLFVKAVLPTVFIVVLAASVVAFGLPELRIGIVRVVYFYFLIRLFAVLILDRAFLLSWWKFVAHAAIGILLASLAYEHLILPNKSLLPNLETAGNEVWLAIFAFFYAIMNKVPLPEGPTAHRRNRFIGRKYEEARCKFGPAIDERVSDDVLKLLVFSIIIFEDYARPPIFRILERALPWRAGRTTGIMQVTAERKLSDLESVERGTDRLVEAWKSAQNQELTGWERTQFVVNEQNRDDDYFSNVTDVAELIAKRADRSLEHAYEEIWEAAE
jgi:hypothetical protein